MLILNARYGPCYATALSRRRQIVVEYKLAHLDAA